MIPLKWCYKCRQNLPLESFTLSRRDKSGAMCSACQQAYSRAHYQANREKRLKQTSEYQRTHPEQRRAYSRKAYAKNPEYYAEWQRTHPESRQDTRRRYYDQNAEKLRAGSTEWRANNPSYAKHRYQRLKARYQAQGAAYYERNKDRKNAKGRAHYQANKIAYRKYYTKRRALKRSAAIGHVDYAAIWERDNGICYLCGQLVDRADLHFDHVIPLSKGGAHSMENIRVTHETCNKRKGVKILF